MTETETNETPGVDRAKQTARDAKKTVEERGEALKAEARDGVQSARAKIEDEAERGKDRAVGSVSDTADALGDAASSAREGSVQQQLLSEASHGLSSVAAELEGKSLSEMVGGVSDFARRNPVAFLGGMALAGFAMSRFARASAKTDRHGASSPGYPSGGGGSAYRPASPAVRRPSEGDL